MILAADTAIIYCCFDTETENTKAELPQLNHTQFPSLGIFASKKVGNRKN